MRLSSLLLIEVNPLLQFWGNKSNQRSTEVYTTYRNSKQKNLQRDSEWRSIDEEKDLGNNDNLLERKEGYKWWSHGNEITYLVQTMNSMYNYSTSKDKTVCWMKYSNIGHSVHLIYKHWFNYEFKEINASKVQNHKSP